MSSSLSPQNPLSYMGVRPVTPAPVTFQTTAPTTGDIDNFTISTIWIDKSSDDVYMLVNKAGGVASWIRLGGDPADLSTITTPDATVVEPTDGNINFLNGAGMNITGSGSDITFNSAGGGLTWSEVTGSTETLAEGNGYLANNGGGVTFTLPSTAQVGDSYTVVAVNAGGWSIAQNASQDIRIGNQITTTGIGGSLASSSIGDTISIVCFDTNNNFIVINSMGNITVT